MRTAGVYITSDMKSVASVWSLRRFLGHILFVALLLSMINGLMPQVEMFLFDGNLLIPTVVLKFVVILIAVLGVIIKSRLSLPKNLTYALEILVLYLVLETVFLFLRKT